MNPTDFLALVSILSSADGGCSVCFCRLVEQCYKRFPYWPWDQLPEAADYDHDTEQLTRLLADLRAGKSVD